MSSNDTKMKLSSEVDKPVSVNNNTQFITLVSNVFIQMPPAAKEEEAPAQTSDVVTTISTEANDAGQCHAEEDTTGIAPPPPPRPIPTLSRWKSLVSFFTKNRADSGSGTGLKDDSSVHSVTTESQSSAVPIPSARAVVDRKPSPSPDPAPSVAPVPVTQTKTEESLPIVKDERLPNGALKLRRHDSLVEPRAVDWSVFGERHDGYKRAQMSDDDLDSEMSGEHGEEEEEEERVWEAVIPTGGDESGSVKAEAEDEETHTAALSTITITLDPAPTSPQPAAFDGVEFPMPPETHAAALSTTALDPASTSPQSAVFDVVEFPIPMPPSPIHRTLLFQQPTTPIPASPSPPPPYSDVKPFVADSQSVVAEAFSSTRRPSPRSARCAPSPTQSPAPPHDLALLLAPECQNTDAETPTFQQCSATSATSSAASDPSSAAVPGPELQSTATEASSLQRPLTSATPSTSTSASASEFTLPSVLASSESVAPAPSASRKRLREGEDDSAETEGDGDARPLKKKRRARKSFVPTEPLRRSLRHKKSALF